MGIRDVTTEIALAKSEASAHGVSFLAVGIHTAGMIYSTIEIDYGDVRAPSRVEEHLEIRRPSTPSKLRVSPKL